MRHVNCPRTDIAADVKTGKIDGANDQFERNGYKGVKAVPLACEGWTL